MVTTPFPTAVVTPAVIAMPPAKMPALVTIAAVLVMAAMMAPITMPAPVLHRGDCGLRIPVDRRHEGQSLRIRRECEAAGEAHHGEQSSHSPQRNCAQGDHREAPVSIAKAGLALGIRDSALPLNAN
ncbi:hypothetical protein [Methylobacterium sp. Leaf89]|uniref:hypothetical protein n=1 Tax=Methylobacterium sp. Leaf89 TaxID=1736245 RepID=UPI0012E7C608|nr:hypothetical protein [Methylobacterium sp. Leaf89]